MFYIIHKEKGWKIHNGNRWLDFDQIGKVKPYTAWITAVEKCHRLESGSVVSAAEIISLLLDKDQTVQILKGGAAERRRHIEELKDRIDRLTSVNTDLIDRIKTLVSNDVSESERVSLTEPTV